MTALCDVLESIRVRWHFLDDDTELPDPSMVSDQQVDFLLGLEKKYGPLQGKLWGLTEDEFRQVRNIQVEQRFRKEYRN